MPADQTCHDCYDTSVSSQRAHLANWKRCVCSSCDVLTAARGHTASAPGGFLFSWLPLHFSGLLAAGSLIMRSSCLRLRGFRCSEEPSLVRNPKLAPLWYACRRRALGGSVETGCPPPPPHHAACLWSKPKGREAAD